MNIYVNKNYAKYGAIYVKESYSEYNAQENSANRKYKDSVFTALFRDKKVMIETFEILNPELKGMYTENDIEDVTLINVVMNGIYNDVAFKVGSKVIVLLEHQTKKNFNIPLRMLQYIASIYQEFVVKNEKNIYGSKLISLPEPKFYVINNNDILEKEMLLSSAFPNNNKTPALELRVNVIKNENDFPKECTINGFLTFCDKVEEYKKEGNKLEIAIKKAITYCIKNNILVNFLREREEEVFDMLRVEYSMEDIKRLEREIGVEEGIEQGIERGIDQGKRQIVKKLIAFGMKPNEVSIATGLTLGEIQRLTD